MIALLMLLCVVLGALAHALFLIWKEENKKQKVHSEIREKIIFDSTLDTDVLLERSNARLRDEHRSGSVGSSSPKAEKPKT